MPEDKPKRGRPSRQGEIVAATENLLHEKGLSGVTTRAIAEAVGCSEGAIYVHFASRLELILSAFESMLPEMIEPFGALGQKAGHATPRANLLQAARGLARFHERAVPLLGSLFAEPKLLQGFRGTLAARQKGPQRGVSRLALYIDEEKKLGRVAAHVDSDTVATTLMAISLFNAFSKTLLGKAPSMASVSRCLDALLGEQS